jgi:Putative Flp pilus-assembly TadE/G-like
VHVTFRLVGRGERGGVLVMVALWMPVLAIVMTFVIDVGNAFEHKRHLQMQADAAALAAAQEMRLPCSDPPVLAAAGSYGGDTYNAQIGGTAPSRIHRLINSKTYYDQADKGSDDTVESPPCSASMVDVKLTETSLGWLSQPLATWFPDRALEPLEYINAHARVSIQQIETSNGALPLGVPDTNPRAARAYFVNEATGAVLGSTALTRAGTNGNLIVWDNAGAPLPVTFASDAVDVGVVIALGGATSTTCGQPLVSCYDAGAGTFASALPNQGILHVRGWSAAGSGLQPANDPILRSAELVPGSCTDPYFSAAAASCTVGIRAKVDFGTLNGVDQTNAVGAQLTAKAGGQSFAMTYDAATKVWSSATTIPVAPSAGPIPISIDWAETTGTLHGNTCRTGNGNKCTGTFANAQRTFGASEARSGPIKAAVISEAGVNWADSFERCSAVQTSCTHSLVVRIGVAGNLGNASSVNDPVVALRVIGGSQNQSLDCDPAASQLKAELAGGCAPIYGINHGTACPASVSALWATAQPWRCVAVQTGSATNQVPAGMNQRVLGDEHATTCTSPNHWSQFPNIPRDDPRYLQVFLTPFGSFSGNGSTTVPVTDFAEFYITGWTASGGGFANPCQGQGDDPVPNNDPGTIVGHFVKYIANVSQGTGGASCDMTAFGSCIAVLTR